MPLQRSPASSYLGEALIGHHARLLLQLELLLVVMAEAMG